LIETSTILQKQERTTISRAAGRIAAAVVGHGLDRRDAALTASTATLVF
jgi:hypothetical protein